MSEIKCMVCGGSHFRKGYYGKVKLKKRNVNKRKTSMIGNNLENSYFSN